MSLLISLLFIPIAVFAAAYLTKYTDGPDDIFLKFRGWVGVSGDDALRDTFLAKLFACWLCYTTWLCLFASIYAVLVYTLSVFSLPLLWLGSWTGVQMLRRWLCGLEL